MRNDRVIVDNMLKRAVCCFLLIAISLLIPAGAKRITQGFKISKMRLALPFSSDWDVPSQISDEEAMNILAQPYRYLGKGIQCYAFVSGDGRYVLKLFRFDQRHFFKNKSKCIPKQLEKLGILQGGSPDFAAGTSDHCREARRERGRIIWGTADAVKNQLFKLFGYTPRAGGSIGQSCSRPERVKRDRVRYIFDQKTSDFFRGCKLAYTKALQETGILYLHLNETQGKLPVLRAKGPLGQSLRIPLDSFRFALQKKAVPLALGLFAALDEGTLSKRIDAIVTLLEQRIAKGIGNTDPNLWRNFGFLDDRVIEFDFGNYIFRPDLSDLEKAREELERYIRPLRSWLELNAPERLPDLNSRVERAFL